MLIAGGGSTQVGAPVRAAQAAAQLGKPRLIPRVLVGWQVPHVGGVTEVVLTRAVDVLIDTIGLVGLVISKIINKINNILVYKQSEN